MGRTPFFLKFFIPRFVGGTLPPQSSLAHPLSPVLVRWFLWDPVCLESLSLDSAACFDSGACHPPSQSSSFQSSHFHLLYHFSCLYHSRLLPPIQAMWSSNLEINPSALGTGVCLRLGKGKAEEGLDREAGEAGQGRVGKGETGRTGSERYKNHVTWSRESRREGHNLNEKGRRAVG